MAASGYKLFATGDVLTAADVNNYLMLQTVMVFADSAARTTALSGVLAEGLVSYLKSTDVVEIYTGAAWVSLDDPNAVQNASYYAAGKNAIINGAFNVNQRNFTSVATDGAYTFDRWKMSQGGSGTLTVTPQTFTAGTAPVTGYEGTNYVQLVTASTSGTTDYKIYNQPIEDVRTFANTTVTASFWAKTTSGTPKLAVELFQNFGSGGSTGVGTYAGQATLSTSWTRYTVSIAIPSISGKTIGTSSSLQLQLWASAGSDFNARTGSLGNQNGTFQVWGVQLEIGASATAFQTASGSIGGELALCQRYFWRLYGNASNVTILSTGFQDTSSGYFPLVAPVLMRGTPTGGVSANADITLTNAGGVATTTLANFDVLYPYGAALRLATSNTLVLGQACSARIAAGATKYIELSAEL